MLIERLSVQGNDRSRTLEVEFSPGFSLVIAADSRTRHAIITGINMLGVACSRRDTASAATGSGARPGEVSRVAMIVRDGENRRIQLSRDVSARTGVRAIDLDAGVEVDAPVRPLDASSDAAAPATAASCAVPVIVIPDAAVCGRAVRPDETGRPSARVRTSHLPVEHAAMVSRAIGLIDVAREAGDAQALVADPGHEAAEAALNSAFEARERRTSLCSRKAWIAERIAYLDSRLSAIDSALRAYAERMDVEEYITSLKDEFEALRTRQAQAEIARRACLQARADRNAFAGKEAAFEPSVAAEVRSLAAGLAGLERQSIDCEAEQSAISSRVAHLRADLAAVELSISDMGTGKYSKSVLGQVQSLAISIEEKEMRHADLSEAIAGLDLPIRQKKLSDRITLAGAGAVALSLIGIMLPGDSLGVFGSSVPGTPVLVILFSLGLMAAIFGFARGMELDSKAEQRDRLTKERATIFRQLTWNRQQLSALIGGESIDSYMDSLERVRQLEERRDKLMAEAEQVSARLLAALNQADYLRIEVVRRRERMAELMRLTGYSSYSSYLDEYERWRKVDSAYREAARRLQSILDGRTEETFAADMELIAEEIALAEARRDALADPRTEGRTAELSDEYGLKYAEALDLIDERSAIDEALRDTEQELASVDIWELASAAAEAAKARNDMAVERKAADLAGRAMREVLAEQVAAAGDMMAALASRAFAAMSDARCRFEWRIDGDWLVVGARPDPTPAAGSTEGGTSSYDVEASLAAEIGAAETACTGAANAPSPAAEGPVVMVSQVTPGGGRAKPSHTGRLRPDMAARIARALTGLSGRRQVIWISDGAEITDEFIAQCGPSIHVTLL